MRRQLPITKLVLSFLIGICVAANADPIFMTKLIVRYAAPDLPNSSSGAQPKTMYVAGNRYVRVEEKGTRKKIRNITIVNGPDQWVIDLETKTGRHTASFGSDGARRPILGLTSPRECFDFAFGQEIDFLMHAAPESLGSKKIGESNCEVRQFKAGNFQVVALIDAVRKIPVEFEVFENGKLNFQLHYMVYQRALPFDPSFFQPPEDITWVSN